MSETLEASTGCLITTREAANLLGIHPTTLRIARAKRHLPIPHVKVGGAIRYRREDINAFIHANLKGGHDGHEGAA